MRSKRQVEGSILAGQVLQQVEEGEREIQWVDRVCEDLQARGLPRERAERVATQLTEGRRWDALSPDQYESLLDGASMSFEADAEDTHSPLASGDAANHEQVREIERMMQAFSGELTKLDESLEVLSAYVRRMREQPAAKRRKVGSKTLH